MHIQGPTFTDYGALDISKSGGIAFQALRKKIIKTNEFTPYIAEKFQNFFRQQPFFGQKMLFLEYYILFLHLKLVLKLKSVLIW